VEVGFVSYQDKKATPLAKERTQALIQPVAAWSKLGDGDDLEAFRVHFLENPNHPGGRQAEGKWMKRRRKESWIENVAIEVEYDPASLLCLPGHCRHDAIWIARNLGPR